MTVSLSSEQKRASRPPAQPAVSVIIPVRNGAHYLRRTLPALRRELPAHWEIIVVDDSSTDDSVAVAAPLADFVVPSGHVRSAPAARNAGARKASGDVLVFLDADILVTRHALLELVRALEKPGTACTFGMYSEGRHLKTLGGRFKNVWVRHTYLAAPKRTRWMNTALTAIRTSDFWSVGGYDFKDDWIRGGNDIDFGRIVSERVGDVVLLHDVDCDHLKEMSLFGLMANDFNRTRGFFRLSVESRELRNVTRTRSFGNIPLGFMGGVVTAGLFMGGLALAPFARTPGLSLAAAGAIGNTLLGAGFFRYALPRLGRWAPLAPAVLLIDQCACFWGLCVESLVLMTRPLKSADPSMPEIRAGAVSNSEADS